MACHFLLNCTVACRNFSNKALSNLLSTSVLMSKLSSCQSCDKIIYLVYSVLSNSKSVHMCVLRLIMIGGSVGYIMYCYAVNINTSSVEF